MTDERPVSHVEVVMTCTDLLATGHVSAFVVNSIDIATITHVALREPVSFHVVCRGSLEAVATNFKVVIMVSIAIVVVDPLDLLYFRIKVVFVHVAGLVKVQVKAADERVMGSISVVVGIV